MERGKSPTAYVAWNVFVWRKGTAKQRNSLYTCR